MATAVQLASEKSIFYVHCKAELENASQRTFGTDMRSCHIHFLAKHNGVLGLSQLPDTGMPTADQN